MMGNLVMFRKDSVLNILSKWVGLRARWAPLGAGSGHLCSRDGGRGRSRGRGLQPATNTPHPLLGPPPAEL